MWVRPHPFLCRPKNSTRVDSTNETDFFKELGLEISMGAADTVGRSRVRMGSRMRVGEGDL